MAIAKTSADFIAACETAIETRLPADAQSEIDHLLQNASWDGIQTAMAEKIEDVLPGDKSPLVRQSPEFDVVVVGAGFAGAVMAERLAGDAGKRVLVIDRRPHIAGNAFDHLNADGILVHKYGPHIFHTNSRDIVDYLSRFTDWRRYEHRVLASVDDKLVPIPINRTTLNAVFGLELTTDDEAAQFLSARQAPKGAVVTSEDVVLQAVGRELYEMFFRGYTRKQWGRDPSQLDRSVTARIPTRTNVDDRYFTDSFQAMPRDGYAPMFAAMLSHPNITVLTRTDYADVKDSYRPALTVYTGQIDAYFGFCFGELPYRSLRFEHETLATPRFQPSGTVNYPDEMVPYTRISEFKHLTGQTHDKTSIVREYPAAEGDPYYPVPTPETAALYRKYAALADREPNVLFVGRLATYQYYNMDQIVGQALATYRRWRASAEAPVPVTGK